LAADELLRAEMPYPPLERMSARSTLGVGRGGRSRADPDSLVAAVEGTLRQADVQQGEAIAVAVSGGLDSVTLLDILLRLRPIFGLRLHVAHMDHGLRPASRTEAEFVSALADRLELPHTIGREDVAAHARHRSLSVEAAGREMRYRFLDRVREATGSRRIALGHHASDQAETVLLRLLRGSGTTGLRAMELLRDDVYLRPMLSLERSHLEQYARLRELSWCEDESNADLRYARNRIRHELIPLLRERHNPRIVEVLSRAATVLGDDDAHLQGMAQQALETVTCERSRRTTVLAAPQVLRYHIAIQRRIIRLALKGLSPNADAVGYRQTEIVLALLGSTRSGLRQLRCGVWAQRSGWRLILRRGLPAPVDRLVKIPGITDIPERALSLQASILSAAVFDGLRAGLGGRRVALDRTVADVPLILRGPRSGDRLRPLGMDGHKKLSHLLIDAKVPRLLRDEVLVLTRGSEIVWVPGLRVGHGFRVGPATRQIALLEFVRPGESAHCMSHETRGCIPN